MSINTAEEVLFKLAASCRSRLIKLSPSMLGIFNACMTVNTVEITTEMPTETEIVFVYK